MNPEVISAIIRTLPFFIVVLVLTIITKRKKKAQELDIRTPFSFTSYLVWVACFLIYALLTEFSLFSFDILKVDEWDHPVAPSIILIFGIIVLAPIAEELLFRGLILNELRKRMNEHLAILVQACFFVILHNFTFENTLSSYIAVVQTLIDGILYGYARKYTKSIYTPITMHMIGNLIAVIERFIL